MQKTLTWINQVNDDGVIHDIVVVVVSRAGAVVDPVGLTSLKFDSTSASKPEELRLAL